MDKKTSSVLIQPLNNFGDTRGDMFRLDDASLSFVHDLHDVHFGTILPGATRGNHYHLSRKEVLILTYIDGCTVAWQEAGSQETIQKAFEGSGTVSFGFDAGVTHAIKNTGTQPMSLIALSDGKPNAEQPDTVRNVLLENIVK